MAPFHGEIIDPAGFHVRTSEKLMEKVVRGKTEDLENHTL